jgi:hypothetical protein
MVEVAAAFLKAVQWFDPIVWQHNLRGNIDRYSSTTQENSQKV